MREEHRDFVENGLPPGDGLLPRRNRAVASNLNRLARGEALVNIVHPVA